MGDGEGRAGGVMGRPAEGSGCNVTSVTSVEEAEVDVAVARQGNAPPGSAPSPVAI